MSRRRNEREFGEGIPLSKKGRAVVAAIRKRLAEADQPPKDVPVPRLEDYVQGIKEREKPNRQLKPRELYARGKWIVRFLRLGDGEEEAAQFQKANPTYFPREFWTSMLPSGDDLYPGILMGADAKSLPACHFWQGYRDLLRAAWEHRFGDDEYISRLWTRPVGKPTDPDDDDFIRQNLEKLPPPKNRLYPFQHDIIALVREPWRARNCEACGKPFVPDKGYRRCCSADCSIKAEHARKLKWWHKKRKRKASKTA